MQVYGLVFMSLNLFYLIFKLAETCQIAADRIKWLQTDAKHENIPTSPFSSIDPAPPMASDCGLTVEELTHQLMDENLSLFKRYRAMFSLRNMRNEQGIEALAEGTPVEY